MWAAFPSFHSVYQMMSGFVCIKTDSRTANQINKNLTNCYTIGFYNEMLCFFIEFFGQLSASYYRGFLIFKFRFLLKLVR